MSEGKLRIAFFEKERKVTMVTGADFSMSEEKIKKAEMATYFSCRTQF